MTRLHDVTVGKFDQFKRELAAAGLTGEDIDSVLVKPSMLTEMVDLLHERLNQSDAAHSLDQFQPLLLSLEDQAQLVTRFNMDYWHADLDLHSVAFDSDHVQSIDDLEILFVDFGSPQQNLENWWKAIAGEQPNAWRWDGLESDEQHLRLGPNTKQYEPGIHRVRINLVANWEPENGRSVLQVRERAAVSGQLLGHAEVLAAYGLHTKLLQQMDGEKLPYADLAGLEASVPGRQPWADVPDLRWFKFSHGAHLGAGWADAVHCYWAAPVVRES